MRELPLVCSFFFDFLMHSGGFFLVPWATSFLLSKYVCCWYHGFVKRLAHTFKSGFLDSCVNVCSCAALNAQASTSVPESGVLLSGDSSRPHILVSVLAGLRDGEVMFCEVHEGGQGPTPVPIFKRVGMYVLKKRFQSIACTVSSSFARGIVGNLMRLTATSIVNPCRRKPVRVVPVPDHEMSSRSREEFLILSDLSWTLHIERTASFVEISQDVPRHIELPEEMLVITPVCVHGVGHAVPFHTPFSERSLCLLLNQALVIGRISGRAQANLQSKTLSEVNPLSLFRSIRSGASVRTRTLFLKSWSSPRSALAE